MTDVNVYNVSGKLKKPPEIRRTPTQIAVCDLYLVTDKKQKKKSTMQEVETVIPITLWNKSAEYWGARLKEGDHIFVTGQLVSENYKTKNNKVYTKLKMYDPMVKILKKNMEEIKTSIPRV